MLVAEVAAPRPTRGFEVEIAAGSRSRRLPARLEGNWACRKSREAVGASEVPFSILGSHADGGKAFPVLL